MIFTPITKNKLALKLTEKVFKQCLLNIDKDYEVKYYDSIMNLVTDYQLGKNHNLDHIVLLGIKTEKDIQICINNLKSLTIDICHYNQINLWGIFGANPQEITDTDCVGDILNWKKKFGSKSFHGTATFLTNGKTSDDELYATNSIKHFLSNNVPKSVFGIANKNKKLKPQIISYDIIANPFAIYSNTLISDVPLSK